MTLGRVLGAALLVSAAASAGAAKADTFTARGAYYFDGSVRCPLAGVGTRGPNACNRVALDDDFSTVAIDRAKRTIVVTNTHVYAKKQVVADVLLLASGVTKAGERAPIAIHLKIEKKHKSFASHVHAHPTIREDVVSADFEPFRVLLFDGTTETTALTPEVALKTVRDPSAMAKLASIFVEVKDNLEGARPHPGVLADVSVGVGLGRLSKMVLRARLEADEAANHAAGAARLSEMFGSGTWSVRLTSMSSLLPKDLLARELFLFGLDDLPVLAGVKQRGLEKGESLVFGMKGGKGTVAAGKETQEIPNALDKARAFLELSFLGAILEHQAELAIAR